MCLYDIQVGEELRAFFPLLILHLLRQHRQGVGKGGFRLAGGRQLGMGMGIGREGNGCVRSIIGDLSLEFSLCHV